MYNQKLFGENLHPAAGALTKTDFITFKTSVGDLYSRLLETYMPEIQANASLYGDVESIEETNHHIKTNKTELDYEKLVSSIPFDALSKYMGQLKTLPAADIWYYLVKTPVLNFEGASEILVADKPFDFYKVTNVAPQTYLFHCLADLGNSKAYLGAFLNNNLDVQKTTQIARAIPVGPPPDVNGLVDIFPVGCHGQWDMFMDVSSSINRLLKYRVNA